MVQKKQMHYWISHPITQWKLYSLFTVKLRWHTFKTRQLTRGQTSVQQVIYVNMVIKFCTDMQSKDSAM